MLPEEQNPSDGSDQDLNDITPPEDRPAAAVHPQEKTDLPPVRPPQEEKKEDVPPQKEEKEEEEEEKEKEEEKEELEEESETQQGDDDVLPNRPSIKDIKTKYPEFFKEFPAMRHMLYREKEYSELFPTVADAKEASEHAQNFEFLQSLVISGKGEDLAEFMGAVKETGEVHLQNMAANFLPALYRSDQNLYFKVTGPLVQQALRQAFNEGKRNNNTDLMYGAQHLAKYLFGDHTFASGEKSVESIQAPKANPEAERLTQERTQFLREKYDSLNTEVIGTIDTSLTRAIVADLPDNLPARVKANIIRDIKDEIGNALAAEKQHMRVMASLWDKAKKAGFTSDWKPRITSAYLARAKAKLPAVRERIVSETLGTTKPKAKEETKNNERGELPRTGNSGSGRGTAQPPAGKTVDWSKTSDQDFLDGKITYK